MLKMRRKFKEWVVDGGVDGGDGGVERVVDGGSLTSWVKTGHGVHYRDLARETKECYQDQDQGSLPSKTPLLFLSYFHFLCQRWEMQKQCLPSLETKTLKMLSCFVADPTLSISYFLQILPNFKPKNPIWRLWDVVFQEGLLHCTLLQAEHKTLNLWNPPVVATSHCFTCFLLNSRAKLGKISSGNFFRIEPNCEWLHTCV